MGRSTIHPYKHIVSFRVNDHKRELLKISTIINAIIVALPAKVDSFVEPFFNFDNQGTPHPTPHPVHMFYFFPQ